MVECPTGNKWGSCGTEISVWEQLRTQGEDWGLCLVPPLSFGTWLQGDTASAAQVAKGAGCPLPGTFSPAPPVELNDCCFQLMLAVGVLSPRSRCAASFPTPVRKALWSRHCCLQEGWQAALRCDQWWVSQPSCYCRAGKDRAKPAGLPGFVRHEAALGQQPTITVSRCSCGDWALLRAWDSQPELSTVSRGLPGRVWCSACRACRPTNFSYV